jgi:hypothetical protein
MTEAQWLKSRDPGGMLDYLHPDEGSRLVYRALPPEEPLPPETAAVADSS